MPGRPPTGGRKSAYLDWSTLADAFEGLTLGASAGQRELSRTVLALAEQTNLCFSLTHVWELVHLEDARKRDDLARWLDGLDLVWTYTDNDVETREMEHAVLDAVLRRKTPLLVPWAPSFLSMFHALNNDEALVFALGHPSLAQLIELLAGSPKINASLGRWCQFSCEGARRLYDDRKLARSQATPEKVAATLDGRLRAMLEAEALRAAARLRADANSGFHIGGCGGLYAPPTDPEVVKALRGFPDLRVLPYVFLAHRYVRNLADAIQDRPSSTSQKHRGDLYDVTHLVGAAYCDVFTCDARTVKRLEGGRELLGLPPPICGCPEVVNTGIVSSVGG